MPNGTYGGVRGKETKVGQKTFVSRPTRLHFLTEVCSFMAVVMLYICIVKMTTQNCM